MSGLLHSPISESYSKHPRNWCLVFRAAVKIQIHPLCCVCVLGQVWMKYDSRNRTLHPMTPFLTFVQRETASPSGEKEGHHFSPHLSFNIAQLHSNNNWGPLSFYNNHVATDFPLRLQLLPGAHTVTNSRTMPDGSALYQALLRAACSSLHIGMLII